MASITIHCPRCNSGRLRRHGKTPACHVRYRCPVCPHVFQLTYTYEARKPGVKEKSVDMAFNGLGVSDTVRVLKIGINTVIRALKKLSPRQMTSEKVVLDDVALICELNEHWAYIDNKNHRHWLWLPLIPRESESWPIRLARATMRYAVAC